MHDILITNNYRVPDKHPCCHNCKHRGWSDYHECSRCKLVRLRPDEYERESLVEPIAICDRYKPI